MEITALEAELVAALRRGLPLTSRPYAALGVPLGLDEAQVIALLTGLRERGVIRRFGAIVRHQEVGFRANAMCVLDVPDSQVAEVGCLLAQASCVTLCYRRRRVLPHWPYNLFCMIHGQDRQRVREQFQHLVVSLGLESLPREVLFSQRRFKQTAGHYGRSGVGGMASATTLDAGAFT
ncbi:MAG: hypothetical protein H7831_13655 [Magnetococcus sp. WYHC-3]